MSNRFAASRVLLLTFAASALLTGCKKADAPQFSPAPGTYTSGQSVTMSSEMVLARAPEVIIELHYGESLKPELLDSERKVWNALPSVPAVRNNRVYLLTGDEFVVPGPRITIAADRFARALHPEAYR